MCLWNSTGGWVHVMVFRSWKKVLIYQRATRGVNQRTDNTTTKKNKKPNNDLLNTTQKTKDWAPRTPLKNREWTLNPNIVNVYQITCFICERVHDCCFQIHSFYFCFCNIQILITPLVSSNSSCKRGVLYS